MVPLAKTEYPARRRSARVAARTSMVPSDAPALSGAR
jgi:hypothetical protein